MTDQDVLDQLAYYGISEYTDPVLGIVVTGANAVTAVDPAAKPTTTPGMTSLTTLSGATIPGVIGGLTPHTWVIASSLGLYHPTYNLAAEWQSDYQIMLAGNGDTLTPFQRLAGNAEAVFENTNLANESAAIQEACREDVQRQIDALAAATQIAAAIYGFDPNAPLTAQTYEEISRIEQTSPVLQELADQGHGLNDPPDFRYNGYTNQFQVGIDQSTLYVGGGTDNGQLALTDFFDDIGLSHSPFPSVAINGTLTSLNQNGTAEISVGAQVSALNNTMFNRVLMPSDFSTDPKATGAVVSIPGADTTPVATPVPTSTTSIYGDPLPATISGVTAHSWTADADGLYQTTANIRVEWLAYYHVMLEGGGANLTPIERLEGNAEAVLENSPASQLPEAQLNALIEDAQRQFDTIGAAMQIDTKTLGIDFSKPMTMLSYLDLEHTIGNNDALLELAMQGQGLVDSPAGKYSGFTAFLQSAAKAAPYYVGGGLDNGASVAQFFNDVVMTHLDFPSVMHDGSYQQLNQNGNLQAPTTSALAAVNDMMYSRVLVPGDFSNNPKAHGPDVTLTTTHTYYPV